MSSSYRSAFFAVSVLLVVLHGIEGRPTSDDSPHAIVSFQTSLVDRAFPTHQQQEHSLASAATTNDFNPCSVLKSNAELQPLDDAYHLCRVKWHRVLCDDVALPLSFFPTELPCNIPPEVGGIRPQCPHGSTDRLPLFVVNSTVHFVGSGKNCDFDVKSRAICDGECLVASSARGRTNCLQPSLTDMTIAAERCE